MLHDVRLRKGMTAPGWKVTMLQCMSWRRSSDATCGKRRLRPPRKEEARDAARRTKRVVAQAPFVSGMGVRGVAASLVINVGA